MRYLAAVVVLSLAPSAFAELISNGSFEDTTAMEAMSGDGYQTISSGSTIGAWSVSAGNVDLIRGYWVSHDGNQSVDLSGSTAGTITQDINTTTGSTYLLTFYMSGNPGGGNAVKSLNVTVGSSTTNFTYNITPAPPGVAPTLSNMQWQLQTLIFTGGAGNTTTITFASQESSVYGPAIDLVSVVPEPSSVALFGLGIAGLGYWRLRRTRRAAAKS